MKEKNRAVPLGSPGREGGARNLVVRLFREKPLGAWGGAVVIVATVLVAILAPVLAPYDPYQISAAQRLLPPSVAHPLGTDDFGRDQLSRIIYGTQVSLIVGVGAVALGTTLASLIGITCGYFGGKLDLAVQRVVDVLMAFPGFVMALTIMAILGQGLANVVIALGLWYMAGHSRIIRSAALSVSQNLYIEAARVVGCSHFRILVRYVLPNVAAPIFVLASMYVGYAIIMETSLSFLGLGVAPPTPSWGSMISGKSRDLLTTAPWMALFPGIAIAVVVFGFNTLGDALRDLLDPKLRISNR